MKSVPKTILVVVAFVAAFSSFDFVDGALSFTVEVECLEKPNVCIGTKVIATPSPFSVCDENQDCVEGYSGGYLWEYEFVEGLEEGITDEEMIDDAKTGLKVRVDFEDDATTCAVSVGDETCDMCSAVDCGGFLPGGCTDFGCETTGTPIAIKYDCTNLKKGKKSLDECVPLEPFVFPLKKKKGNKPNKKPNKKPNMKPNMKPKTKKPKKPKTKKPKKTKNPKKKMKTKAPDV